MSPVLIQLIGFAIEEIVKIAPGAVVAFRELFSKDNPTPDDWDILRAKLLSKSYKTYVPESKLP